MKIIALLPLLCLLPGSTVAAKPVSAPAPVVVDYLQPASVQAVLQKIAQEKDLAGLRALASEQVAAAATLATAGQALANRVEELTAAMATATAARDSLAAEQEKLQLDLKQLRASADALQSANDSLTAQQAELNRAARAKETESLQLAADGAQARADTAQLGRQNSSLSAALQRLQDETAAFQQEKTKRDETIAQLTRAKIELESALAATKAELAADATRIKALYISLLVLFLANTATVLAVKSSRRRAAAGPGGAR